MNINDYLDKLRAKPARERERMAVIATGISFAVILAIWLVSFSEMNKNASPEETGSVPVQDQLEDLKKNAGESKQSIEEMMQGLPQDSTGLENLDDLNTGNQEMGTENQSQNQDINQDINSNQNNQPEIPQLP